jgi:hypothetical protein
MSEPDFAANYRYEEAGDGSVHRLELFGQKYGTPLTEMTFRPSNGESWRGRFREGGYGLNGVFATPDPDTVCVILGGLGYWIPVLDPARHVFVRCAPVIDVVALHDVGVILFVDYSRLAAYDASGLAWEIGSLVDDELAITEVRDGKVRGRGWSSGKDLNFEIDARTGRVESIGPAGPSK